MISVSIGVCAYNEENNVGRLLESLINQKTHNVCIEEIIVVSSGSTDRTDEIVESYSCIDSRVKLIRQPKREGKASAVNEFIKKAKAEVCVLESADTIPLEYTIEKLCSPFCDSGVGMAGGRPIPINDRSTFMGFVGHLIWELHHRISLVKPKLGELVAFRNVIDEIPVDTAVDEAWIEAEIKKRGYKIVYVPDAICYNKTPETVGDFIKQRRRIYAGHLDLKNRLGYEVSTMDLKIIMREIFRMLDLNPKSVVYVFGAMLLEGIGRLLGYYDYHIKKTNHAVWDVARTTKDLGVKYEEVRFNY